MLKQNVDNVDSMTVKDLRSNWIDITVTGTLPTNATAFEIRSLIEFP